MGERESGIWVPPGSSADPGREQPAPSAGPEPEAPSPEELAEQLRRIKVSDVVLSLLPTLAQLAYAKLDPEARDLTEARVAIESIRALLQVLEGTVPAELTRDYGQVVTNLQLAYASAVEETQPAAASDTVSQGADQRGAPDSSDTVSQGAEERGGSGVHEPGRADQADGDGGDPPA